MHYLFMSILYYVSITQILTFYYQYSVEPSKYVIITRLSFLPSEQQPRVRGWLLASLDGQTTGLIPANYVKILGKRRGRKTVESSRISKQQQSFTNTTLIKGATAADSLDDQEAAFESVFVETNKVPVASDSTGKNGDKQDLW